MRKASIAERLDRHTDRSGGEDACWIWVGAKTTDGYGGMSVLGKILRAHREAYKLANGDIPDGMVVCHSCDTPLCVNPRHLWLGTSAENTRDRESKGRGASPKYIRSFGIGEKCPGSKLTDDKVREIRALYAQGMTKTEIGKRFGVTRVCIYSVVNRETWAHVA